MPRIHETAYPRLKSAVTEAELQEIYAPTAEEIAFAEAIRVARPRESACWSY